MVWRFCINRENDDEFRIGVIREELVPLPHNLAQRHQGWLNHTRMRPPLSKRLRSSRHMGSMQ
jgi:hypothetical protein